MATELRCTRCPAIAACSASSTVDGFGGLDLSVQVGWSFRAPDFFTMFGKARPQGREWCRGSMFFAAPDSVVAIAKEKRWRRKYGQTGEDLSHERIMWEDTLTPEQDTRRLIYNKVFLDR